MLKYQDREFQSSLAPLRNPARSTIYRHLKKTIILFYLISSIKYSRLETITSQSDRDKLRFNVVRSGPNIYPTSCPWYLRIFVKIFTLLEIFACREFLNYFNPISNSMGGLIQQKRLESFEQRDFETLNLF